MPRYNIRNPEVYPRFQRKIIINLQSNDFVHLINTQLKMTKFINKLREQDSTVKNYVWVNYHQESKMESEKHGTNQKRAKRA